MWNRSSNILAQNGALTLLNLSYTYDLSSSVTSINNGSYIEYYGYDMLDRMVWGNGLWGDTGYTYDAVGNRLSKSLGGSSISYVYDEMDRITLLLVWCLTGIATVT